MKKIDTISIEIMKDLTEFHGLVRKLHYHGFSRSQMEAMIFGCFLYDVPINNLANVIDIWHKGRIESILRMNPHLNEEEEK